MTVIKKHFSFSLKKKRKTITFLTKIPVYILLLGLSYIIIYPFIFKILVSFMSKSDLYNPLVIKIPEDWTFQNYKYVLSETKFLSAMINTVSYAFAAAIFTMFSTALVGYGLARFKFPGVKLLFGVIILTMLMPIQTVSLPLFTKFRIFDIFGIKKLFGGEGISRINSIIPTLILSTTCLGFRAGIFVILMRQYYIGIPKELIEAAYVDGSGPYRTFFKVILPMAKSMLIVVFSLSFAWQWTDTFYSGLLCGGTKFLPTIVSLLNSTIFGGVNEAIQYVYVNTAALLSVVPLLVFYCIFQKKIIQGIETSGIVG